MGWENRGDLRGPAGTSGSPGASAYELAVQKGYSGTLEQWLLSLRGQFTDNGDGTASWAAWTGNAPGGTGESLVDNGDGSATYTPGTLGSSVDDLGDGSATWVGVGGDVQVSDLGDGSATWSQQGGGSGTVGLTREQVQAIAQDAAALSAEQVRTGSAGGFLSGSFPSPGVNQAALDQSVAGRVNDDASASAVAVRALIARMGLVLSPTAPVNPTPGTVWINTSTT